MSEQEEWRSVPGFPQHEVSNRGRVKGMRGHILTPEVTSDGYLRVFLSYKPRVRRKVHQLVLLAFEGARPDGMQVRHLDGDPQNNELGNLRYGTAAENMQDRLAHGTNPMARKTHCKRGHEFSPENTRVDPRGKRQCRPCDRERYRADRPARVAVSA